MHMAAERHTTMVSLPENELVYLPMQGQITW
jgi:hypothetical protein